MYHTIHSMSVERCQQMIMTDDYLLICDGKRPLIKVGAKKAHAVFVEQLRGLFGGDKELSEMIDLDILLQGMRLKHNLLSVLLDKFNWCYDLRNTPAKIKSLDKAKEYYRDQFFDYPKNVDCKTYQEEFAMSDNEYKIYSKLYADQVKESLKPIVDKMKFLEYKIKEYTPVIDDKPQKQENQTGLELHISFIENVENRNLDRKISVSSLAYKYTVALDKHNKLKSV